MDQSTCHTESYPDEIESHVLQAFRLEWFVVLDPSLIRCCFNSPIAHQTPPREFQRILTQQFER